NGAGKSTTVRVLCTLLAPTAGRAVVAGYDVAADPGKVRLRIGVALQDVALDPKQTGEELLRLQGRLYGLSTGDVRRRLAALTELADIGDALGRPIRTYSRRRRTGRLEAGRRQRRHHRPARRRRRRRPTGRRHS